MTDFYGALGTKYSMRLSVWLVSQNVAANTSTVSYSVTAIKNHSGNGWWNNDPTYWSAVIGGNTPNGSVASYDFDDYTELLIAAGQYVIAHDADGTKSISVSSTWDPDNAPNLAAGSASGTIVLPTIARATVPTVSPTPALVGQTVTISLPRASGSFTHNVTWSSGTMSGSIGTGVGTSTTWTVPDVMDEFPGRPQAPIVISVDTRNGGSSVGVRTTTLMVRDAPTAPELGVQQFPFDIRARLVTFESGVWAPRRTIPAASIQLVDPHSATATCKLVVSRLVVPDIEDYSIVDIEVQDGTQWVSTGLRFSLTRVEDDTTDLSETVTYQGVNFVDFILRFAYTQTKYTWDSVTPGAILQTLINDAQSRGWGPLLEIDFDGTTSSMGTPWVETGIKREIQQGTPYSQVLDGLVSDGLVEYRTSYNSENAYLFVYNPGTGSDWAVAGANPIVDLSTAPLTSAPRRGTNESVFTRVTVAGDGELRRTRERASDDPDVYGQLEGWVAASGITDGGEADRIADNALADAANPTNERTFVFSANAADRHLWPYFSVRPGDWVRIPGVADANPERARVGQITLDLDVDGDITATILTGDLILSGTGALAKRQQAQTGGSIPGGSLQTPAPLDASIPAAPVISSVTSDGYWNSDGAAKSAITITWGAVNTAVNGAALLVDYYEVWWRPDVATPWAMQTISNDLSAVLIGWDVNKYVQLRVRGRSSSGIFGQWALFVEHTTEEPNDPMDAPTVPVVTANALGTIFIEWDGEIGGSPAPAHLAYTRAEISTTELGTYTPAGVPLLSAGSTSVDPGAYGTFWIRLRAVDRLGLEGTPTSGVSITTVDPGLVLRTPKAPTSLASTTGAAFSEDGTTLTAWFDLTWDAVTQDTDDNAIDISGYEVWGYPDTETDPRLLLTTTGEAAQVFVEPGSGWTLTVRAISDVGARGLFATDITDDADATVADLDAPDDPTVSSMKSLLKIEWNGLLGGVSPPNQFRFVFAEIAPTTTGTWVRVGATFARGGGVVFVPLNVGDEYDVRLTAVDAAGNESAASGTATETIVGIDTFDLTPIIENMLTEPRIETDPADDVGVKLYNSGIVAYDTNGDPTIVISAADGTIYFANGVISGDAIVTGSIIASKLDVGSLVTTLISSDLGNSLNLASNDSVNILVGGAVASVQSDVDDLGDSLGEMQTYYQFGPDGALITSPSSTYGILITNSQISMLASGNIVSYWNAAGLVAPSLIADQTATIGAHQFRKEGVRTTVRAL